MLSRRCSEDVVLFHQCYTENLELLAQPCSIGLTVEALLMGCRDRVGFGGMGGTPRSQLLVVMGGLGAAVLGEPRGTVRSDRAGDSGWSVTLA